MDISNPTVYYELDKFYSNHRMFVKSKSYKQLRGESIEINADDCNGASKIKDLLPLDTYSKFTDKNLATDFGPEDDLSPCGNIAKYLFTDSFQLFEGKMDESTSSGEVVNITAQIDIDETNIAHSIDTEVKF